MSEGDVAPPKMVVAEAHNIGKANGIDINCLILIEGRRYLQHPQGNVRVSTEFIDTPAPMSDVQ